MVAVDSAHKPGTIVLAQGQLGRYTEFEQSLDRLQVPRGTKIDRVPSGCCAYGANLGIRERMGEWVWLIDDDHTFRPDLLLALLGHNLPLVAPLVPDRWAPFNLVLYKELGNRDNRFVSVPYHVEEIKEKRGLLRVAGLPKAGLLARDVVFRTMPDPWFKIGRISPDQIDDDRLFMWEARERYGFELWADVEQHMPHLNTTSIGLVRGGDGVLSLRLTVGGYHFPLESPTPAELARQRSASGA